MAELFISKIFGVTVLKLKYEDVLYPVLTTKDLSLIHIYLAGNDEA